MLQNQEIGQRGASGSLRVVYSVQKPPAVSALDSSIGPLLELCLTQTGSQGAYVYRLSASLLELVAWRGAHPTDIPSYSVELSGKAAKWVREAGAYIALEKGAWQDWRFASLPEFLHNRYESAVSVPLIEAGKLNGIVNVCGRLPTRCGPGEGIFLAGLSLPLGSILAKTRLESELEDLNRKLADRKLFDRAKGVLQARFGWTEEDAYLHLRRTSRRTRTPMRSVALHVIQNFALPNEQVA